MELGFTAYDLTLYLDTHPGDQNAIAQHNAVNQQLKNIKMVYEQQCGPLSLEAISAYPWQWINEPWPWQIQY